MRRQGFTLLEVLVVLLLIGILMGIFGFNLIRSIRSAELRESATQVATDLRRARSQAQRGSVDIVVGLPGIIGGSSYTVNGVLRTLKSGITLTCEPNPNCGVNTTTSIVYGAPYGELEVGTGGVTYTMKSSMNGIAPLEIRIFGVTGKTILTKGGS